MNDLRITFISLIIVTYGRCGISKAQMKIFNLDGKWYEMNYNMITPIYIARCSFISKATEAPQIAWQLHVFSFSNFSSLHYLVQSVVDRF